MPPTPRNLAGAVLLVALLGGYQNRKHDPPPGHQIMWRGYERMSPLRRWVIGLRRGGDAREGSRTNSGHRAGLTLFLAEVQRDVRRHVVVWLPAAGRVYRDPVPDIDLMFTRISFRMNGIAAGYLHEILP